MNPLQLATSTLYVATSHWVYWSYALEAPKILEAAQIAINGGFTKPDNPWNVAAQKGADGLGLNVKGDWS